MFITRAYLSKNPNGPSIIFDMPVSVSIKEPTHILAMRRSVQGFVNKTEAYSLPAKQTSNPTHPLLPPQNHLTKGFATPSLGGSLKHPQKIK
jgi:hypothetical protein